MKAEPRKAKPKAKPIDPDLDAWVRLGGAAPESELDTMTEGERLVAEGNAWAREQLMLSTRRPATLANPFRRE